MLHFTWPLLLATFCIIIAVPPINTLPASDGSLTSRGPNSLSMYDRRQAGAAGIGFLFETLFTGLIGGASKELDSVFGGGYPTCCDNDLDTCRLNAGKSKAGHGFQACYQQGTEEIFDFDVEAMKCIINLHYLQPDKCIDIKGSTCGTGYGGGLMNGEMGWWTTKGVDKQNLISAQDSRTLQAAAESMKGIKIDYARGAIELVVVSDTNGVLSLEIDFAGHQGKEC